MILTINTAHAFFEKLWKPLSELSKTAAVAEEAVEDTLDIPADIGNTCSGILLALQSMLLSLGRTQSQLCSGSAVDESEFRQMFENLRREWSSNLATQLINS